MNRSSSSSHLLWALALCLIGLFASPAAAQPQGKPQPQGQAEPFGYFANDWNVLGLKDYEGGARIGPDSRIYLDKQVSLQLACGEKATPLTPRNVKTALEGWMPIMVIHAADGSVQYEFTCFAAPLPSVSDWKKAFAWPTEGDNFLVWINYKATNTSGAPAQARVEIASTPSDARPIRSFTRTLAPGESFTGASQFAYQPLEHPEAFDHEDGQVWLERTVACWHELLHTGTSIEVPCRKATDALKAAHVCQLIASDYGVLRGGEGIYDKFYDRDGAYQLLEIEEAGMWDMARSTLEAFLASQRSDGRFETNPDQFDGNGQAVWALWHFYQMTGDRKMLERAYPAMRRAADWTIQARRAAPPDSPFAGLLGSVYADGEGLYDGKHHIVGYDLWNLRAVLLTAQAAKALGRNDEAAELSKEADAYRADMEKAWKRTGLPYFPPSWEGEGTPWGNTESLWPTPLFAPDDPRVTSLIETVRTKYAGGFVEGCIRWVRQRDDVIHPYMTSYTTMADLARGRDAQVVEDFFWYLLHSTASNAFGEGIYYQRNVAWNNTLPHVTGASNYAILLRHMLVHEVGDELHLFAAVPDAWLEEGKEIKLDHLPTIFGEVSLHATGTATGVRVAFTPPADRPPAKIILHLPDNRPPEEPVPGVTIVTRPPQPVRWEWDLVQERYKELKTWRSLTIEKPVTCSSSLPDHKPELANDAVCDRKCWAAAPTEHNPWWRVDLEQPAPVTRVVVVGYYLDKRSYGFTVEGSLDGEAWTMLADRRDNTEAATKQGYVCECTPRPVRYLRVTMTSTTASDGQYLVEVMAFQK